MSSISSIANRFRKRSVWIIAVFVTLNILNYLLMEFLYESMNHWILFGILAVSGLALFGVLIMSLANSIDLVRKTELRKNLLWLALSAFPLVPTLISGIAALVRMPG